TPSFRPHSGRKNQLGFPGAEAFHHLYSDSNIAEGIGHFETEEEWLTRLQPDVLIAFFGFNESFQGRAGLDNFRAELDAYLKHTLSQKYNGRKAPQLALVSPTAYQDRSATMNVPDGRLENANLAAYTAVMEAVSAEHEVHFVNAFNASLEWHDSSRRALTADGALFNDAGYERLSAFLVEELFGEWNRQPNAHANLVAEAVTEKNWFWINDFKMPNGVHVFGRRYNPFGPANYPFEIEKIREMTVIRDEAIWEALQGHKLDLLALDAMTSELPEVDTNYKAGGKNGTLSFLKGEEALATIKVPAGYKLEQWATEDEFPDLANPVQMSFDNKGRLWVATMPSYPHYRPGDPRPDDKLLILEDTDGDGKADKQTVFADKLHLPMGFEFAPEGVYLSQGINLVLLQDRDGDDHADRREVIMSGFDDHDTHHAIGAYCADPSGALMMCEGVFLRTNVETAYGPVRGTNGGFYRYAPQRRHLERHAQLSIPNPWGIAFDDWGQHFFIHTSGPKTEWMLPGSVKPRYGVSSPGSRDLIETAHRVRPTSGIEFLFSSHFPDDVQGDMLINNSIGFLGTKQHRMMDAGTGYETKWRQDLTVSTDGNYRPVDIEVAPDGSLYIVDWHNPLIGHMQHNARDPHRDHGHGRIYRITYPSRALVEPAKVAGASIEQLLENLKLHEYRSRYRSRRELRGHKPEVVLPILADWVAGLDAEDPKFEHHLVEALWVSWGLDRIDEGLLRRLLHADDYRARAAAVRAVRYNGHRIDDQAELLEHAAADEHGRVKMEAIVAASWIDRDEGLAVLAQSTSHLKPKPIEANANVRIEQDGRLIQVSHPAIASGKVSSFKMSVAGNQKIINLAEMEILSGGENVTGKATLTQSSEYNGGEHPIGNLVDGNKGNFSHTSTENNPWIEVRFDKPIAIDEVKIWNRPGFETRFTPAQVAFFDGKKTLVSLDVKIEKPTIFGDTWLDAPYKTAMAHLNNQSIVEEVVVEIPDHLKGDARTMYVEGAEIFARDGHCSTCHQPDGLGLQAAGFPPLAGTEWAIGDEDRLIQLTLNGLLGPIEVSGKHYPGLVPMTPFAGLLDNNEIAAVLTYVRSSWGNQASVITAEKVEQVRVATQSKVGFYSPDELMGGAATTSRAFVKMWSMTDFESSLDGQMSGRDLENGKAMFAVASCTNCHNIEGQGANVGADLSSVAKQYRAEEILRHILEPSWKIKDTHRLFSIELEDESFYNGLIVERTSDTLRVAEDIQKPEDTVTLALGDVIEIRSLEVSAMPSGLLITLDQGEVLDLLAYIVANGKQ
ncbi:MAG: putative heme-binding domain-containing protein, partial [Planctomycetota bacterium]